MTDRPEQDSEPANILARLGPLARLDGVWEGDAGLDTSPGKTGPVETRFRERMSFEPFGPVVNGPQELYGLRYTTTAWPLNAEQPFHEETGYWLWDSDREEVMRCFMVPRGVTVLAGGKAPPEAKSFSMAAERGATTFGILSNPFLDQAFRTERYELTVSLNSNGTLSYHEDTQLRLQGVADIFHHTDRNRLNRCA